MGEARETRSSQEVAPTLTSAEAAKLDRLRAAWDEVNGGLRELLPPKVTAEEFSLLFRGGSYRPLIRALLNELSEWRLENPKHEADRARLLALVSLDWPSYFGRAYNSIRKQFSEEELSLVDALAGDDRTFANWILELGIARLTRSPRAARRYVRSQRRWHKAGIVGLLMAMPLVLVLWALQEWPKTTIAALFLAVIAWFVLSR